MLVIAFDGDPANRVPVNLNDVRDEDEQWFIDNLVFVFVERISLEEFRLNAAIGQIDLFLGNFSISMETGGKSCEQSFAEFRILCSEYMSQTRH